jgi:hypothetical protein
MQPQKMKKVYDESRYENAHELLQKVAGNEFGDPPIFINTK